MKPPAKRAERRTARGLVLARTSGFVDVAIGDEVVRCRMRGRLKQADGSTDLVAIGDDVVVELAERGEPLVSEVAPRRTRLARRHPGRGARVVEDVIVANLDRALVCVARRSPSLRAGVLDRFLVVAAAGDVPATIVVTKADLPAAEDEDALLSLYRQLGHRVVFVSTRGEPGVDALRAEIGEGIVALVGPSGVGKSSLANALVPGLAQEVGEVDEASARGRHTTRLAQLLPLPAGGYLADTPGIRELEVHGVPPGELDRLFPEIDRLRGRCRFRDCKHDAEPGCAVRDAVERGALHASRYASYLRMCRGDEEE